MKEENRYCLYTDINNFKLINDTYGHTVGDLVIEHYGDMLVKTFQTDSTEKVDDDLVYIQSSKALVFRYGGDEFIVFTSCTDKKLKLLLEQLHKNLLSQFVKKTVRFEGLSASIGIIDIHNYNHIELADTTEKSPIGVADLVMYFAKGITKSFFSRIGPDGKKMVAFGAIAMQQSVDPNAIAKYTKIRIQTDLNKDEREEQENQILDEFYEKHIGLFKHIQWEQDENIAC